MCFPTQSSIICGSRDFGLMETCMEFVNARHNKSPQRWHSMTHHFERNGLELKVGSSVGAVGINTTPCCRLLKKSCRRTVTQYHHSLGPNSLPPCPLTPSGGCRHSETYK